MSLSKALTLNTLHTKYADITHQKPPPPNASKKHMIQ